MVRGRSLRSVAERPPGLPGPARAVPAPERLIPDLLAAGAITRVEAMSAEVVLFPVGRSHAVYRLEVDGVPRIAAKLFGPRLGETDGEVDRERAVAALAGSLPAVAALVPPAIPHEGSPGVVLRCWFDGRPASEQDAEGAGAATDLLQLAPRLALLLAGLHRATARLHRAGGLDQVFVAPLPWVLRLFDGDGSAELWANPLLLPVLREAGARPALVTGLRRARGAWREVALIHGDLKHDNLLLGPRGEMAAVDWEHACLGDPAWDLAGLMSRPLLHAAAEGEIWRRDNLAAGRALIGCYAEASRIKALPLAQRLLLYCGAWIVMNLVQYCSRTARPDEAAVGRFFAAAETCLGAGDATARTLAEDAGVP